MYPDDSIMCCLFPNRCNMFPQTPGVIFSSSMEYLNMIIVFSTPLIVVWSLMLIVIQFVEGKKNKLIKRNDSEDSCFEDLSLQKVVRAECTESEYFPDEDGTNTCSDSDLKLSFIKQKLDASDKSNSDCQSSILISSESIIKNTDISKRSGSSTKQCLGYSSGDETEERVHDINDEHDFITFARTKSITNGRSFTLVPEKIFLQAVQKEKLEKSKDLLPVSNTDSSNQQQSQNEHTDHQA